MTAYKIVHSKMIINNQGTDINGDRLAAMVTWLGSTE